MQLSAYGRLCTYCWSQITMQVLVYSCSLQSQTQYLY